MDYWIKINGDFNAKSSGRNLVLRMSVSLKYMDGLIYTACFC